MPSVASTLVPIFPAGAVSSATVLWRDRGQLRLTAIVKATFAFGQEAPMRRIDPAPLHAAEVHHQGNPACSIAAASDLAPFLPLADVVVVGHAYAFPGAPASSVGLRLVVSRDRVLLDKTLVATGEKAAGGRIAPFKRMPVVYERTFGGVGRRDNPLGVGLESDRRTANIIDPAHPGRCAGFGPISRSWPSRKDMLTAEQHRALEQPIIEIPPGFDWSYFQAAPRDQRIEHLHGDELIEIEGMHPKLGRIRTRLPTATGAARIYDLPGGMSYMLPLVLDTLHIDTDAERCSATWRGNVPIPNENSLLGVRLAGGVALQYAPVAWPTDPGVPASAGGASELLGLSAERTAIFEDPPRGAGATQPPRATDRRDAASPVSILEEPTWTLATKSIPNPHAPRRDALPFEGANAPRERPSKPPSAQIPGAPWAGEPARPAPRVRPDLEGTVDLTSILAPDDTGSDLEGTVDLTLIPALDDADLEGTVDLTPIPAPSDAPPPPATLAPTLDLPELIPPPPTSLAPRSRPAAKAPWAVAAGEESPANISAGAAASGAGAADLWRKPEAQEVPPPAPSRPQSRPSVKGDVYKKFKKPSER